MRQLVIAQTPSLSGSLPTWHVAIDGKPHRQYPDQWDAIVSAFTAAQDATRRGEEATIVMETAGKQAWTFSMTPDARKQEPKPAAESEIPFGSGGGRNGRTDAPFAILHHPAGRS